MPEISFYLETFFDKFSPDHIPFLLGKLNEHAI